MTNDIVFLEVVDNSDGVLFKNGKEYVRVPQNKLDAPATDYPIGFQVVPVSHWELIKRTGTPVLPT